MRDLNELWRANLETARRGGKARGGGRRPGRMIPYRQRRAKKMIEEIGEAGPNRRMSKTFRNQNPLLDVDVEKHLIKLTLAVTNDVVLNLPSRKQVDHALRQGLAILEAPFLSSNALRPLSHSVPLSPSSTLLSELFNNLSLPRITTLT